MANPLVCPEIAESKAEQHNDGVKEHKVVIHLGCGDVLKGSITCNGSPDPSAIFENEDVSEIEVKLLKSEEWLRIPIEEVKAVFFVKSFRGDSKRKTLRFYSNGPELGPVWAEVRFQDNEVLEGKIENSARHLMGNGFVMRPTDSGGNNLLVYVNKKAMSGYRVLGVRANRERAE